MTIDPIDMSCRIRIACKVFSTNDLVIPHKEKIYIRIPHGYSWIWITTNIPTVVIRNIRNRKYGTFRQN